MIIGFDDLPKLSGKTKRAIAELGGSPYFNALKELIEYELIPKATELIDNPMTPESQRLAHIGGKNAIIELLQRVRQIQSEVFEDGD